jgi:hypothetical protein
MAKPSPKARSMAEMRSRGYHVEDTERRVPYAHITHDLLGFIDLLAFHHDGSIIAIQATSSANLAARVDKIRTHENLPIARRCGWLVFAHGWAKRADGHWHLREIDCS